MLQVEGDYPSNSIWFFNYGVDVITLGNHVWDKKEIIEFIEHEPNLIRPANYPPPPTPRKRCSNS